MRICVGEYIADELAARGWTTRDAAQRMGGVNGEVDVDELMLDLYMAQVSAPEGHAILDAVMSDATAAKLARAFGTSAEVWKRLDEAYHERKAMR